jgi:2-keto-4-pentenoate hydratase
VARDARKPPMTAAELLAVPRLANRGSADLPAELVPGSLADAYRVQDELVDALIAKRGGRRIGYKIACSNAIAQKLLNVDAPLFGRLMSATTHESPARLRASDFNVRCIEPEFGFEMAEDVPAGNYDADTIRRFVKNAFPCIELVNHYFRDWTRLGAPLLVADNAIHGAWITGAPFAGWKELDFPSQAVILKVGGKTVQTGSGAAVLGSPLNALAWLANELPRQGAMLRKGDKVSTGVATDVYLARAGDELEADFGALGSAKLSLK